MIKGIIFDADGTILDSMKFWDNVVVNLLLSQDVQPEKNLTEILTPMSMAEGAEYVKKRYSLKLSAEEIIEAENRMADEFYSQKVDLKKGAGKFLEFLLQRDIPCVIASATDRHLIESAVKHLNINTCFKRIFSCSDLGEGKSSPKIFLTASEFMGFSPNEVLVAEDSFTALTTAKKAGFKTLAVFDSTQKEYWGDIEKTADLSLKDGFELAEIISSFL